MERERERVTTYDEALERDRQSRGTAAAGKVVIHADERPWQITRQGKLKYFLMPMYTDTVTGNWRVFAQEIHTHSGKHVHQGGLAIFILDGSGYTVMDGVRYDWQTNDLLLLPVQPGGIEHQHFNDDASKPVLWLATIYEPYRSAVASELEQRAEAGDGETQGHDPTLHYPGADAGWRHAPHPPSPADADFGRPLPRGAREGGRLTPHASRLTHDRSLFDQLLELRDSQRQEQSTATRTVRGSDLPLEVNRHGLMRWYLHPATSGLATRALIYFIQEIPPASRSGKQRHQGDVVHYVLDGEGYTEIDGQPHPWAAGDVIVLPLKGEGVVFQHFNASPTRRARLISVQANLIDALGVDLGSGFEELEPAPEYNS